MTPGFAKSRAQLPWLPYGKCNRVIINQHNFPPVSGWTPASTTTYLWLDASDTTTIYDASSGGSLTADGGNVGRINDKSGNNRHATQATSGSRPVRSGSSIVFSAKTLNVPVAALGSLISDRMIIGVYNGSTTGGTGIGFVTVESTPVDNPQLRFGIAASGNQIAHYWNGGYATTATVAVATKKVHGITFASGIAWNSYEDGTSVSSGTRSGTWSTINEFTLGGSVRGGGTRNGTLFELIVCNSSDRVIMEGYLAWKHGLQSSLPAGHTYKSVAP